MDEENVARKLTALESRTASNTRRIESLERGQEEIRRLTSAVQVLAVRQGNTARSVNAVSEQLNELTSRPQKRWEAVADRLIVAAASILIGWLLASMGVGT